MLLKALISSICQPNPKTIKDTHEGEVLFKRNQSVLITEIILLLIVFVSALMGKSPNFVVHVFTLANLLRFITFLCTCRSYQTLFKTLYFLNMTLFGPLVLYLKSDFVFGNFISVYFLPICTLYLNGRKTFFLQVAVQITLLQLYYRHYMVEALEIMSHIDYAKRLTNVTTCGVIIISAFVVCSQKSLIEAHKQIMTEQTKKVELERQKTFHLSFSHELRNLINTMLGSIQLCILESLPEKVKDLLQNSEVCGELLLHLINNILDTGKVEIGELEINATSTLVYDTFEKVWGICSQLIKGKQLKGQMRIQKNLPKILKIDNYRLMQIMMNLLGNAIKFTDRGSINIGIQWIDDTETVSDRSFEPVPYDEESEGLFEKEQAVTLLDKTSTILDLENRKLKRNNDSRQSAVTKGILKIIVTDTGCGVSAEKLPLLFNKFSQVSDDPSIRKLGTGLGLFITKELIERMNGKIRVFSKAGQGTTFIACFPTDVIEQTDISQIGKKTFVGLAKSKRLRAMIVDDVDFNIDILSNYLTRLGVEVVDSAKNGKEALEKFQAHARAKNYLDIVTMDVEMPIMDGKKATHLIRKYERDFNLVPCLMVMVSGNCTESEIAECVEIEKTDTPTKADMFMKKPASINDLLKAMKIRFEDGTWSAGASEIL